MTVFLTDAYTDKPTTRRGELEERVRQLKCAAALRALDHAGDGNAA